MGLANRPPISPDFKSAASISNLAQSARSLNACAGYRHAQFVARGLQPNGGGR